MSQAINEGIGEVFHFSDTSYSTNIIAKFHRQRLDGQFLDVTLKAGETTIVAHRSFLAAFAEYFELLFTAGMLESRMSEIELKDIDGVALALIIDFAYSGEIDIMPGNISSVLEIANYLCVDAVKNACCRYLWEHIHFDNAFDVLALASRFQCFQLYDQVKRYIVERFQMIAASSTFFDIDEKVLFELVSDDRLVFMEEGFCVSSARQEQLVLESVLRYVKHDEASRVGLLEQFLSSAVRLPLIPSEMIVDTRQHFAELLPLTAALDAALCMRQIPDSVLLRKRVTTGIKLELDRLLARNIISQQQAQLYDDFNVPVTEPRYVTGMLIHVRKWDGRPVIGGLSIQYNFGQKVLVGEDNFSLGSCHEFHLEHDERIVRATVGAGWMVDRLTFFTNRNRQFGPFGGPGGSEHKFDNSTEPGTYLAGIQCRVEYHENLACLRHFGLVWAKFTYSQ